MKPNTGPAHRIRQFLFHARTFGLGAAFRTTGRFLGARARPPMHQDASRYQMSWSQFESRFLARRELYEGVFVQNVVIEWNGSFQRPQQMALALGRLGYLVIYKTPYPVLDDVVGVFNVAPNVYLTSNESFDFIEGAVHSVYSTSFVHPLDWIEGRDSSFRAIYEYVDHIDPKISGNEKNVRHLVAQKRHAFVEDRYDFVVASSRRLEAEAVAAIGRDRVVYVPNGVDVRHYRNGSRGDVPLPEDLLKFRDRYANVVGYFGAIAPWLWYAELAKLTDDRPDLGFVFIGPDYHDCVRRLPRTDNVLRLEAVAYETLPAYADLFDVCFIPFEPGEIARTTSPLKLFEYFALEKPVVVTSDMDECTAFQEVFSGDGAASWSAAIDRAVGIESDRAFKERLARLADENSWDNRARLLENVFPERPAAPPDRAGPVIARPPASSVAPPAVRSKAR